MILFFGKHFTLRHPPLKKKINLAVFSLIWQAALNRGLKIATRVCCELDKPVHCVNHVCKLVGDLPTLCLALCFSTLAFWGSKLVLIHQLVCFFFFFYILEASKYE